MNILFWGLRSVLLVVWFTTISAKVTVENNGYQNVMVSFSRTVPPQGGKNFVELTKQILGDASDVLHTAIGLSIAKVTFLLPDSWDVSSWENVTIVPTSVKQKISAVDIMLDGATDGAFGKDPFTVQYGGCGVPGKIIRIPTAFLSSGNEFPKGKLLAREWLKYRYGVFDENGFSKDDMYPLYYIIPGSEPHLVQINDCTNEVVDYSFKNNEGKACMVNVDSNTGFPENEDSKCFIFPENTENITSSLMYYQEKLTEMQHICGGENHAHNIISPNKQNLLCSGRSIENVVKLSPDFGNPTEGELPTEREIEYIFVQETNPRVVIAWENTEKLKKHEQGISSAIARLLYDLPDGSRYGLYPFEDAKMQENKKIDLQELKDWPTDRNVPILSDFAEVDPACTSCAISKATEVLLQDGGDVKMSGYVIVITTVDPDKNILQEFKDSQLCLIVIGFTDLGASESGFEEFVSDSSCSSFWGLSSTEPNDVMFSKLYQAMETILPRIIENTVTTTVMTNMISFERSVKIPVDENAESYTLWLAGRIEPGNVICTSSDKGVILRPAVRTMTMTALNFLPTSKEEISCTLRLPSLSEMIAQVQMKSKAGTYIDVHVWIQDTTKRPALAAAEGTQMPIIIYVSVFYDDYPVKNAEVKAVVTKPDSQTTQIDLYDDGRGDPDITAHDGIYSRYFTDLVYEGKYAVEIKVTDNGRQAAAGRNGVNRCCGSIIHSEDKEVPAFEKMTKISFQTMSKKPPYGYPPSRITDLRVANINSINITLKWTAPGGEADYGTASRYEFKLFCDQEECAEDGKLPLWVRTPDKPFPKSFGSVQQATILFTKTLNTQIFKLGVVAISDKDQISDLSNIISITTVLQNETTTLKPTILKDKPVDQNPLGIIIGCTVIAVLLIICLIGIIFMQQKRKKRNSIESHDIGDNTNDQADTIKSTKQFIALSHKTSHSSMRRVESFPVVLYTHEQIKDFKNTEKDPPLYESGLVPKPWMSLDVLSDRKLDKLANKSLGSSSTIHIMDSNALHSEEMKQLDNISHVSEPQTEKIEKF